MPPPGVNPPGLFVTPPSSGPPGDHALASYPSRIAQFERIVLDRYGPAQVGIGADFFPPSIRLTVCSKVNSVPNHYGSRTPVALGFKQSIEPLSFQILS